jgi:conjugative transposon TraK protein
MLLVMFKSLININSAWQQIRFLSIIFVFALVALVGYVVFTSMQTVQKAQERVYILDQGSLLEALSHNVHENRPVEAKHHVKRFHDLFFTLDPDEKAIAYNIGQSLFLADASAKREYENLQEKGFYNDLIAANISQNLTTDSVYVDMSKFPYYARFYGRQQILRSSSLTVRTLISECYLRDVTRSDNNPHGFLIEKFTVLQNADLNTTAR